MKNNKCKLKKQIFSSLNTVSPLFQYIYVGLEMVQWRQHLLLQFFKMYFHRSTCHSHKSSIQLQKKDRMRLQKWYIQLTVNQRFRPHPVSTSSHWCHVVGDLCHIRICLGCWCFKIYPFMYSVYQYFTGSGLLNVKSKPITTNFGFRFNTNMHLF